VIRVGIRLVFMSMSQDGLRRVVWNLLHAAAESVFFVAVCLPEDFRSGVASMCTGRCSCRKRDAMKPGTVIQLPDGRIATVVYHGLDGYGIRWGRITVDPEQILRGDGNTMRFLGGHEGDSPANYRYFPEAMLRDAYSSAALECVGRVFSVVPEGG